MSEKMEYTIARTERPACYPERLTDYAHAWDSRDAEYDSLVPDFTSPVVLANAESFDSGGKWADDANVDPVCLPYQRATLITCMLTHTSCAKALQLRCNDNIYVIFLQR